jgi:hypothetical protein
MAGYEVATVPSDARGLVDLSALEKLVDDDVAGLMITNPNTLGLFEKDILEIARVIHDVGGLLYYDGANLNAILGPVPSPWTRNWHRSFPPRWWSGPRTARSDGITTDRTPSVGSTASTGISAFWSERTRTYSVMGATDSARWGSERCSMLGTWRSG